MNDSKSITKKVYDYSQIVFKKLGTGLHSFFTYVKSSRKILLLIAIVAIISVASSTLVSSLLTRSSSDVYLPSLGNIKTVEVEIYWDSSGEHIRDNLSWDEIEPGKSVNTTVYIKSVSNFKVTLSLKLTDWNPPEISDYITISWDYNGTLVNPGEIIPVTMTLSASSSNDFIDYLVVNEIKGFAVDVHFLASN